MLFMLRNWSLKGNVNFFKSVQQFLALLRYNVFRLCVDISADKESAFLVLDRVRHSVQCVIPCDVLQSDPLLGNTESPFDIIISVFCLECAVSSPKEYPSTVSNVVHLLNPSGHLIMMVNITWYNSGNTFF
jgi:hypothetical protein